MEYKFAVLTEEIPACRGLRVGDAVLPVTSETADGGYELEVWCRLRDNVPFKSRVEHHGKFEHHTVEGETRRELWDAIEAVCEEVRRRG